MKQQPKGFTTKALNTTPAASDPHHALHMPIYDGVAYEFDSAEDIEAAFAGRKVAHAYSRTSNPTVEHFERKLKNTTDAHAVVALASGMAAISNALLAIVEPGANIVASNHLFGHSYALLRNTLPQWGIEVRWADMSQPDDVAQKTDDGTRVYFFETITNPQLEVADIAQLSQLARSRGVVLMADSTITPPCVFRSKDWGVDVEVLSATKFLSGGAAAVGGVVLDNGSFDWHTLPALQNWHERFGRDAFVARIRKEIFRHLGASMVAHTAHFLNLGIDLMALRVDRCVDNCLALGAFLQAHPQVQRVDYPGLTSHPSHALAMRQFGGQPGAVLTFDLADQAACYRFYNQLQWVRRATNLNDNKSLIIHPFSTIYAEFPEAERLAMGVRPTMMRLSVGIEDIDDLKADFEQALRAV